MLSHQGVTVLERIRRIKRYDLNQVVVVAHAFNPSTRKAEVGGFLSSRPSWSTKWVSGQPRLYRETLSQKKKKKKKKKKSCIFSNHTKKFKPGCFWNTFFKNKRMRERERARLVRETESDNSGWTLRFQKLMPSSESLSWLEDQHVALSSC